jgi:ribosomal protein S10
MKVKTTYVRQDRQKPVRQAVERTRRAVAHGRDGSTVKTHGRRRKTQRVWTLNRSPHGNKTAREQFGRQRWQRKREHVDPSVRTEVRRSEGGKVKRKETQVTRS